MPRITRKLVNGGPTGSLLRDEVDVVTVALMQGRYDDVVSGRVLLEYRAAMGRPSGRPPRPRRTRPEAGHGSARL